MDSSSPDWNLLPHRPEDFFGLDGDFDRRELKKRYHRLIKQFKPERYPEEFQKIRAAFEQLDERLRYLNQPGGPRGFGSPPRTVPVTETQSAVEAAVVDRRRELAESLQTQSAAAVYQQLTAQPPQSPFDYYARAVLCDVTQADQPVKFGLWLLKGLKQFPGDPGLFQLFHGFCRSPLSTKDAALLVQESIKVLNGPFYFFVTEELWLQLLRKLPFEKFAKLLSLCENQLKGDVLFSKLVFYLRILRICFWKAPEKWRARRYAFLEKNFELIPDSLHGELDFLEHLTQYLAGRDEFVGNDPVRGMFDLMLRVFCEADELQAEKTFLEFQIYVHSNPDKVLSAFPLGEAIFPPALMLYRYVAAEMESRLVEESEPLSQKHVVQRIVDLLLAQEKRTNNSFLGVCWMASIFAVAGGQYMILGAVAIALIVLAPAPVALVPAWCIAWFFLFYRYLLPKVRLWLILTFSRLCYKSFWRDAVIRLVRVSRIDPFAIAQIMSNVVVDGVEINHLFAYYLSEDFAISLLAFSQRFT